MATAIPQGGDYDITLFQGGSFSRTFTLKKKVDGVLELLPIPGYTTGKAQVRAAAGDPDALVEFDVVVVVVDSTVTMSLVADDTEELDFKNAVYDLALINTNGIDVLYLVEGNVRLNKRVTVV